MMFIPRVSVDIHWPLPAIQCGDVSVLWHHLHAVVWAQLLTVFILVWTVSKGGLATIMAGHGTGWQWNQGE